MLATRASSLALILVASTLAAGCVDSSDVQTTVDVAYPRYGDVASYELEGAFVDFLRWNNGFHVSDGTPLVLSVADGAMHYDGYRDIHETYTASYDVNGVLRHERYVSVLRAGVAQGFSPLGSDEAVVSFDDRGYPWAFGASVLHGKTLREGDDHPFSLAGNAGQGPPEALGRGAPLQLSWRVVSVEDERAHVELRGAENVTWSLTLRDGSAYPERVSVHWNGTGLAPYVRVDEPGDFRMDATLVDVQTGGDAVPPPDPGAPPWMEMPHAADYRLWDGEKPPDGEGLYVPFPFGDAVAAAKTLDAGLQEWLEQNPDAHVYRGTYFESPGEVPSTVVRHWLLQWVNPEGEYYEVQVDETQPDALADERGQVRTIDHSGPAEAPRGEHGWFPADAIPERLLTLSDGVRIMRELFHPDGVEIFLRSFTEPVGYAYYVDGGFETGERYTVIVNAQTGFVQAAVGPVSPRVFEDEGPSV